MIPQASFLLGNRPGRVGCLAVARRVMSLTMLSFCPFSLLRIGTFGIETLLNGSEMRSVGFTCLMVVFGGPPSARAAEGLSIRSPVCAVRR